MPKKTKQIENRQLPKLEYRAAIKPESINDEARTAVFIASTGSRGLRRSWWDDDYYEELEISDKAIRMERLNNGAPFLRDHRSHSISNQLGVIERAWIEKKQLLIEVRFSGREDVDPVWQDVKDGILRSVSVGYIIHEFKRSKQEDDLDVYRAIDWEPHEVSLVTIGFDDGAKVRSQENESQSMYPVVINRADSEEYEMPEKIKKENESPASTGITEDEVKRASEAAAKQAVEAERQRSSDIYLAVSKARLGAELAQKLVSDGVTVDEARAQIIDKVHEQEPPHDTRSIVTHGHDNQQRVLAMRSSMQDALSHRVTHSPLSDDGREFRGMTLMEMGRFFLESSGISTRGMSRLDLAGRALSTSDFAYIFMDVANKTLQHSYENVEKTFLRLGRKATATDFKPMHRVKMGTFSDLKKKGENGEFEYGTVKDDGMSYAIATYGKQTSFTREMLINDDMDALSRMFELFGSAGARLECDLVWEHLLSNPTMNDSKALFHTNHGNLLTAAGIDKASVSAARKAMRGQKNMDGRIIGGIRPKFLVCGADKETEAESFLNATIYPTSQDDAVPNRLRSSLELVVEDRIPGNQWMNFADPSTIDTFEYCYLEGNSGVHMESEMQFLTGGIKLGCRHDFAAQAIDHRGMSKNPGA